LSSTTRNSYLAAHTWITWNSTTSTASFTFANYVTDGIGTRTKTLPAFDAFFDAASSSFTGEDMTQSPEVQEFGVNGSSITNARHFTNFSDEYVDNTSISNNEQTIVNMMNPMYYFGQKNSSSAQYWFIRDGSIATDSSAMEMVDLATKAENLFGSSHVTFLEYWDGGHAVNEDPNTFINWLAGVTGYVD
jgi:hypothetical protein